MSNQTVAKNDFIELEFTGKVKDGEIFDTNIKEDAEKIGLKHNGKPLIICIGQEMVVSGFDKALEEKEVDKKYYIELEPKEAFKERIPSLVKLVPMKIFQEKKINPYPGMTLQVDNDLVRIVSVSGGRVLVDFNNPLAGKIIIYDFIIKRKLEKIEDKINAITEFFFGRTFEFKLTDDKKKAFFKVPSSDKKEMQIPEQYFEMLINTLNQRFKDILGIEMAVEMNKEIKKEENI